MHWALSWPNCYSCLPAKFQTQHCHSSSTHHLPQWSVWSVWCFCSVCSSAFNGSIAGAWFFGRFLTYSLCSAYLNSQIQPNPFYHSSNLVHARRRSWKRPMLGCLQPCRRRLAAALQCMCGWSRSMAQCRSDKTLHWVFAIWKRSVEDALDLDLHLIFWIRFLTKLCVMACLWDSRSTSASLAFWKTRSWKGLSTLLQWASVAITVLSTFYQLFYQLFINLFINFLSTSLSTCYQLFYQLFFINCFYQLFINCLSTFYQLFSNCLSTVLSTFYQLYIKYWSTVYQLFINFLSMFVNILSNFTY